MRMKKIAEACMWLPGFAPDEDPVHVLGAFTQLEPANEPLAIKPMAAHQVPTKVVWTRLCAKDFEGLSGAVTKYEANIAAIKLLKSLETECRVPNESERLVLNKYTGWGGLPQAFVEDGSDEGWNSRSVSLKKLLTEREYASAKASTPNAHYTSVDIIDGMWSAVQRLGFKGGRVLEPAAGVGYFVGAMPEHMAKESSVTAVELDEVSARITSALYKDYGAQIFNAGFESVNLPESFFDLAISNVPFGNYKVVENRNVEYANYSIHNYFFAKAIEAVRPGGLVVFITSSFTMDAISTKVRAYLSSKANLVAAIRLPNSAFKRIASTEVTTDIIILQKTGEGCPPTRGNDWLESIILDRASPINGQTYGAREIWCNKYFAQNPQWVIGKLKECDNGYSKSSGCVFDGDLTDELQKRIALLPENIYKANTKAEIVEGVRLSLTQAHRPGYRLIDGRVYEVVSNTAQPVKASTKTLERIRGLIEVRDAAKKLISAQVATDDDAVVESYRVALRVSYDQFVARHGAIHLKANKQAFKSDPDFPLLLALESWDDEIQKAEKTDIFLRRTVGVCKRVESCKSTLEALLVSISEKGLVCPERIGELIGKPKEDVMAELEMDAAVFLNPENGMYETADEYLSGNVREKLTSARLAGERFAANVKALEAVLPKDLMPQEISARIGSTWIPASVYEQFIDQLLDLEGNTVAFNQIAGTWNVDENFRANYSVSSTQTYGTAKVNALKLFELALNQSLPKVYKPDPSGSDKRVVDKEETIAAREKQALIKEKFVEWVWADDARALKLTRLYNDIFNSVVQRKYDGSHLVLPGFSTVYRLREHQMNAVWRIVSSGRNTLLAHAVGAGKTLEMICAGMELKRIGKASKPMYVVPNHMLEQFASEFIRAYPGANILMASKDDLQGDKRRELISKITTCDWDGVLITHSSFERIKMSDEYLSNYIKAEIAEIELAILSESADRGNRIVKELEKAKKIWNVRLAKLSAKNKKDDLLNFEDLGIDWLFVDEAHYFKNLFRHTKMVNVAGLPNSNSERAFDMFVKTRYIMDKHRGDSGVVFATGTPVANSMAEMWVMQKFLQPRSLYKHQIGAFDTWAGNFGESVAALELAPDGSGYRMQTRFARFVNLPELMGIFSEVADIRTAEMLNLPVPKAIKETVAIKGSDELKSFVETLVERAEMIRSGLVSPSVDNMLSVTNDGRKAALDMRLVWPSSHEEGKSLECAAKVFSIWRETEESRGTQLVFCDLSTPKNDGSFSVYQDLRDKLMEMGVPANEIAFIHSYESDAAKAELFKAVRDGVIRVLIGSTSKMGVGTNVQTRLVALHHLDAPWRPADIEQREGRIIRQGNLNEEVRIYRYVTQGSFDAYLWQTLETKARFIAQVMQGDTGMRCVEDVELAALSYAEVKALASGNPLVLEKAGVDTEVAKLAILKSKWDSQQWSNKAELARLPMMIDHAKSRVEKIKMDCKHISGFKNDFDYRLVRVDGKSFPTKNETAEAITKKMLQIGIRNESEVASFEGFMIEVSYDGEDRGWSAMLVGSADYELGSVRGGMQVLTKVEREIADLERHLQAAEQRVANLVRRKSDLELISTQPFDKMDRLLTLRKRQEEIDIELGLIEDENSAVDEPEESSASVD